MFRKDRANPVFQEILVAERILVSRAKSFDRSKVKKLARQLVERCLEDSAEISNVSERLRLMSLIAYWAPVAFEEEKHEPVLRLEDPIGGLTYRWPQERSDPSGVWADLYYDKAVRELTIATMARESAARKALHTTEARLPRVVPALARRQRAAAITLVFDGALSTVEFEPFVSSEEQVASPRVKYVDIMTQPEGRRIVLSGSREISNDYVDIMTQPGGHRIVLSGSGEISNEKVLISSIFSAGFSGA